MEIVINDSKTFFSDVKEGSLFIFDGDLFMKVCLGDRTDDNAMAVGADNSCEFSDGAIVRIVTKITVE